MFNDGPAAGPAPDRRAARGANPAVILAGAPSPSLLRRLLKGEGGAAELQSRCHSCWRSLTVSIETLLKGEGGAAEWQSRCHSAGAPSPSLLKRLLKGEGDAAELTETLAGGSGTTPSPPTTPAPCVPSTSVGFCALPVPGIAVDPTAVDPTAVGLDGSTGVGSNSEHRVVSTRCV